MYFVPALIAMARGKRNFGAIVALNIFLGWTLVGWVMALVWSLMQDPPVITAAGSPEQATKEVYSDQF